MSTQFRMLTSVNVIAFALATSVTLGQVPGPPPNYGAVTVLNPLPATGYSTCHKQVGVTSCALLYQGTGAAPDTVFDQCGLGPCTNWLDLCNGNGDNVARLYSFGDAGHWNNNGELVGTTTTEMKMAQAVNSWFCMLGWNCKCQREGISNSTFKCSGYDLTGADIATAIIDWSFVPVNACGATGGDS